MESLRFLSAAPSQLESRVTTAESDIDANTEAIASKSTVSLSGTTLTIDETDHTLADPTEVSNNTEAIASKSTVSLSGTTLTIDGVDHTIASSSSVSVDPVGSVTKIDALEVDGSNYTIQPQDYEYQASYEESNIGSIDVNDTGPSFWSDNGVYYNGVNTISASVNILLGETLDHYVHWNSSNLVHKRGANTGSITANMTDVAINSLATVFIYLSSGILYYYRNGSQIFQITTTGAQKCALTSDGNTFAILYSTTVEIYHSGNKRFFVPSPSSFSTSAPSHVTYNL
jgi:hypothetical protein